MKSEKGIVVLIIVSYAIIAASNFLVQKHLNDMNYAIRNLIPYAIFPSFLLLSLSGRTSVKAATLFFGLLLGILSIYGMFISWSEYVFGEKTIYSVELCFYFVAAIVLYKVGYLKFGRRGE